MEVPYGFCISKAGRYRNDSRSDRGARRRRKSWDQIKQESEKKMEQILKEEKERHHSVIDNLENDYNQNRKAYVKEILERIIEV